MKITEKTSYKISELTLGTVQLGIPYGINNTHGMPTYEEAATILQTALDNGIVSFDTARGYGKSEAVLGKFFTENPTEKTIITKVEFEKETLTEVRDSLFNKVKDSATVMGLEKIPVVLLHSEAYLDAYGKTLVEAMQALKAEGLVQSVGISFSDKSRLMELTDSNVFDSVQIPANMFDNAEIRNGKIKELSDAGISVYVRSVYLQGLFFMDGHLLPEKIRSAKPALDKLKDLAAEHNMSVAAMAVSFIRDTNGVESLVMGCETPAQLIESVSLFDTPKLSKNVTDKIMEISEEVEPVVIRPWEWN